MSGNVPSYSLLLKPGQQESQIDPVECKSGCSFNLLFALSLQRCYLSWFTCTGHSSSPRPPLALGVALFRIGSEILSDQFWFIVGSIRRPLSHVYTFVSRCFPVPYVYPFCSIWTKTTKRPVCCRLNKVWMIFRYLTLWQWMRGTKVVVSCLDLL